MSKPVDPAPEFMTAEEVIARISKTRHPRDLEAEIGKDLGWLRSEFRSVMPGLEYFAAIDRDDDHEAAELSIKLIEALQAERCLASIVESFRLEKGLNAVQARLERTGQRAADLLSILRPKMDEVRRAEDARKSARTQLRAMAASGKFKMSGFLAKDHDGRHPKVGAKRKPIDSSCLAWDRQHFIDDYDCVVTHTGELVCGGLQFRTGEIDAYLAAEGGAAGESASPARPNVIAPPQSPRVGRPPVKEAVKEIYDARRRAGYAPAGTKSAEAEGILAAWPTEKTPAGKTKKPPKPKNKTVVKHISPLWPQIRR